MRHVLATVAVIAAGLAFIFLTLPSGATQPSPTHVAAVFADGENHADFRQSCAQIEASIVRKLWGSQSHCQAYFTVAFSQSAYGGSVGGYKIVPHSAKITGNRATVRMVWPGGIDTLTLVKTKAGWKVENVA